LVWSGVQAIFSVRVWLVGLRDFLVKVIVVVVVVGVVVRRGGGRDFCLRLGLFFHGVLLLLRSFLQVQLLAVHAAFRVAAIKAADKAMPATVGTFNVIIIVVIDLIVADIQVIQIHHAHLHGDQVDQSPASDHSASRSGLRLSRLSQGDQDIWAFFYHAEADDPTDVVTTDVLQA
jgi:hypothetical protein